ncbi:MAG TPA: hypothetical protein VGO93_17910 [Candidatus Xenobia bacterium]
MSNHRQQQDTIDAIGAASSTQGQAARTNFQYGAGAAAVAQTGAVSPPHIGAPRPVTAASIASSTLGNRILR